MTTRGNMAHGRRGSRERPPGSSVELVASLEPELNRNENEEVNSEPTVVSGNMENVVNEDQEEMDPITLALLRALNRVASISIRGVSHGTVAKRLCSSGDELFKGIIETTPTVVEYSMETTERILDDLDCTPKQKLKGVVSLLRDEAYRLWQSIIRGTLLERISLPYFQEAFQSKFLGPRYVESHQLEFIELK